MPPRKNPSFEVNPALVFPDGRVFTLKSLSDDALVRILKRGFDRFQIKGLGLALETLTPEAFAYIAAVSDGDARFALTSLETCVLNRKGSAPLDVARYRGHGR